MAEQYVDVDGNDEFFSAWVSARIARVPGTLHRTTPADTDRSEW